MSWETHWSAWHRVHPGYWEREDGACEAIQTGRRTWTLSWAQSLHDETRYRTLKAAQAAADELG